MQFTLQCYRKIQFQTGIMLFLYHFRIHDKEGNSIDKHHRGRQCRIASCSRIFKSRNDCKGNLEPDLPSWSSAGTEGSCRVYQ